MGSEMYAPLKFVLPPLTQNSGYSAVSASLSNFRILYLRNRFASIFSGWRTLENILSNTRNKLSEGALMGEGGGDKSDVLYSDGL